MHVGVLALTSRRGCAAEAGEISMSDIVFAADAWMGRLLVLKTCTWGETVFIKQSRNKWDTCFSLCPVTLSTSSYITWGWEIFPFHLFMQQLVITTTKANVFKLHYAEQDYFILVFAVCIGLELASSTVKSSNMSWFLFDCIFAFSSSLL